MAVTVWPESRPCGSHVTSGTDENIKDFIQDFWHLIDEDGDDLLSHSEWKHTLFAFTYANAW